MATIRAYTTIEQSRKLAEILPLETADMYYACGAIAPPDIMIGNKQDYRCYTICWSLAALLDVLPKYELYNFGDTIQLDVNREALATEDDETLLDLVVNMIIHLYEIKVL